MITIPRFEALQEDKMNKTRLTIIDHKSDTKIVALNFKNEEIDKVIAAKFIEVIEEAIENNEIDF